MCIAPTKLPNKLLPEKNWQAVPCGKCPECLSLRAVHWASRVEQELSENPDNNSFITLTYDDEKKSDYDYAYSDFQKFMKSLRFSHKHIKLKHFTSLEYGGKNGRLHFHSIIFNWYPSNRNHTLTELKKTDSGFSIFRSSELEKHWTHGYSSVAPATAKTAYYIASYALSDSNYECPISGEILSDKLRCSQGIGLNHFLKHRGSIIASAIFNGHSIPRYYKKKLEQLYPNEYEKFTLELTALKKSIIDNHDSYARLRDHISKSALLSSAFRTDKSFELLEAQLNPFILDEQLQRRYGKR